MASRKKALIQTKPLPKPELSDSIRWWTDKGNFNVDLYLRICSIKSSIR